MKLLKFDVLEELSKNTNEDETKKKKNNAESLVNQMKEYKVPGLTCVPDSQ